MAETVRLVRIGDWLHFLLLPLVAIDLQQADLALILRSVVLAAGCLAFAYGFNELNDRAHARSGPGVPAPAVAKAVIAAIAIATVALGLSGSSVTRWACFTAIAGGMLYSGGPRLKEHPIVVTLCNAWIFAPLCLLGASDWAMPRQTWLLCIAFVAALLQNQLIHEAAHREADLQDGICTTVLRFGTTAGQIGAIGFGVAFAGVVALLGQWMTPRWAFLPALVPVLGLTALLARPRVLDDPGRSAALRRWQRYAAMLSGGVAWAALQG